MADWLIEYNTEIPHHSLQIKTPTQCQMLWTNYKNLTFKQGLL